MTTDKFLKVLSIGIREEVTKEFGYSIEEWTDIITCAQRQNIFPLIFEMASCSTNFQTHPLYTAYLSNAMSMIAGQVNRTSAFLNLYQAFIEGDCKPLVMKGIVCRQLYGDYADHRPSGDEDIIVKIQDFDKLKSIMIQEGYFPEKEISIKNLEKLKEVSFSNPNLRLSVDVHVNAIGFDNNLRTKMNGYFKNVFDNSIQMEIDSQIIYTMSYTDHFLFLVMHAFKHFTNGGFGIRQLVDILLFEEKHRKDIDWMNIDKSLKEIKADVFLNDLRYIGNKYLNFDLTVSSDIRCPNGLLEDMMQSGTFGNGTHEQVIAQQMTHAAMRDNNKRTVVNIFQMAFPNMKYMEERNPELKEKPWMLPLCWIHRWKKFLNFNKSSGGNIMLKGTQISKKRIALLSKYDIL